MIGADEEVGKNATGNLYQKTYNFQLAQKYNRIEEAGLVQISHEDENGGYLSILPFLTKIKETSKKWLLILGQRSNSRENYSSHCNIEKFVSMTLIPFSILQ